MQVLATCPGCKTTYYLTAQHIDRRVRCRKCRLLFKVPDESEMKNALDTLAESSAQLYVDDQGNKYA